VRTPRIVNPNLKNFFASLHGHCWKSGSSLPVLNTQLRSNGQLTCGKSFILSRGFTRRFIVHRGSLSISHGELWLRLAILPPCVYLKLPVSERQLHRIPGRDWRRSSLRVRKFFFPIPDGT